MNVRIKELRLYLKMNQENFGSILGVTNAAISRIEKGERNLTDQMIISICREFNVSEEWLRTGEGEMFVNLPIEDEYFKAATEISKTDDKMAMQALIEYWKLSDESKKLFKEYISNIVANSKE